MKNINVDDSHFESMFDDIVSVKPLDGKVIKFTVQEAIFSKTLKDLIYEVGVDQVLDLNIDRQTLKIIKEFTHEFIKRKLEALPDEDIVPDNFHNSYFREFGDKYCHYPKEGTWILIANAANYMHHSVLLRAIEMYIAWCINTACVPDDADQSVANIREVLKIKNDFTEDEEAAVKQESSFLE